jgi:hypothetical protein
VAFLVTHTTFALSSFLGLIMVIGVVAKALEVAGTIKLAGKGYAFSSNGQDGTLTIVQQVSGEWQTVDTVKTARGSRTMTVDESTHRVYLPSVVYAAPDAYQPSRAASNYWS